MRFRFVAVVMLSASSAFAQPSAAPVFPPPVTRVSGPALMRLRMQLWLLQFSGTSATLPPVDAFSMGNRLVPAGTRIDGPVGIMDGSLDVFGTISGTVIVIDGNLRLHPGAQVNGDALAVHGRVMNQGGSVSGEARSLGTLSFESQDKTPGPPHTTLWALKLTLAWFGVLVVIGVGVMIFAEANLDGVVMALERGVGRAFLAGILGQIAALPALLLLCVALALTIIGILLVPFAIVAYIIAAAGLVTLGFLAVARLSGIPAVRGSDLSPRGINLRAMFIGLIGYLGIWVLAAALTSQPMIGGILRIVALIVTWVAATAGLGATLLSRAGTQRPTRRHASTPADEYSWQTPTPVSGVAASRRK